MTDGEVLKRFIDNQSKSKVKIAEDLGMSRQNLFQYFKSLVLLAETKKKFEEYFGKAIFTKEAIEKIGKENFYKIASEIKNNSKEKNAQEDKDAKIAALQYENLQLRLGIIETNLKECLSNQAVIMRQVAVAMHLAAERYVGADKKKLQEELHKIDILISSVHE